MKKIAAAIAIAVVACLYSCKESFLDTTATDRYNEENFWKTEIHALAAINACYAVARDGNLFGGQNLWMENYTPNSMASGTNVQLALGTHNAGNMNLFQLRWNADYGGIGRTNNVLANLDKVQMDPALLERVRGEAYFLRAFHYADLVNYYGGVPLILEAPDFEKQKDLPRNTRAEIIVQILDDLDNAINRLPLFYNGMDKGRATKGAAMGLKTRVLLYEGRWAEAAAAAKEVIDLKQYDLYPDYRGLFMLENEGNEEVLFDIQFVEPDYTNSNDIYLELQMNVAPTLDLVNSYYMIDGKPIGESGLYNPEEPYENRDPRLHKTVVIPGYMFRGGIVSDTKYFSTGYGFKKYTTYKDNVKEPDFLRSEINYIFLRYADILLMYAEAQNEIAESDPSVYAALNAIRLRAGMPDIPPGLSKEEMREVIRNERRIELAGEGLYYNDIRRWRTAEVVMNASALNRKGEIIQRRIFNPERDYLWPIHAVTLQENPALEQNPGYH